ncbi:MAG TPA: hypothetical protein VMJ32_16020 [Pirellulales bacterium]|nr:hypothetical protein [Pirellulales bacterium]
MKLSAWHLTAVTGALLMAAGSLRAQTPEVLPEPGNPSSMIAQPSISIAQPTTSLFETQPDLHPSDVPSQSGDTSSKLAIEGEHIEGGSAEDAMAPEPRAYPASSGYWWRDGCWYGDFDFVIWNRTRPAKQILGVEENSNSQLTGNFLNAQGHALPLDAGGRGTLGYILDRDSENRDHSIEFTYLGFNNWEGTDSLAAQGGNSLAIVPLGLSFPGFTGSSAATYTTTYRSDLQSMELDYRVRNRPGRDQMMMGPDGFWSRHLSQGRTESFFVGLRGIAEEEKFNWISGTFPASPTTFSGDYQLNTKNHLLGFQVGGDCYDVHEGWYWGVKGDAGIYCNFADGFAHVVGIDTSQSSTPFIIGGKADNQTAAFLGELSLVAGYDINDHLMLHAGWDLVQLGGLASAPNEVSFTSFLTEVTPFIRNDGQIFYNGLSLGLEAYW